MSKKPKTEQLEFGWQRSQLPGLPFSPQPQDALAIARTMADALLAQIREKRFPPLDLTATPEALARLVWRQMGREIFKAFGDDVRYSDPPETSDRPF
jgi:hypothetical protein